ncbi:MAG: hypothetical protein KDA99_29220, partial [Planctomycetales bacterium]|nr:hypothetical protein [Planctomycetales bacterium]
YGIGYAIAARDAARHWPIILVGLLGKILGPVGFLQAAWAGHLPWSWGIVNLANDLIWWLPFSAILYLAYRHNTNSAAGHGPLTLPEAMVRCQSQRGATLQQLSIDRPTLVVFLRHAGCTFCREALDDLARLTHAKTADQFHLAIVHMGNPMAGTMMLRRYDLREAHQYSDPKCAMYEAFDLGRGRLHQLISPTVVLRGILSLLHGNGLGPIAGDGFRLPGVFLLQDGRVTYAYRAGRASDRPIYDEILRAHGGLTITPAGGAEVYPGISQSVV